MWTLFDPKFSFFFFFFLEFAQLNPLHTNSVKKKEDRRCPLLLYIYSATCILQETENGTENHITCLSHICRFASSSVFPIPIPGSTHPYMEWFFSFLSLSMFESYSFAQRYTCASVEVRRSKPNQPITARHQSTRQRKTQRTQATSEDTAKRKTAKTPKRFKIANSQSLLPE